MGHDRVTPDALRGGAPHSSEMFADHPDSQMRNAATQWTTRIRGFFHFVKLSQRGVD